MFEGVVLTKITAFPVTGWDSLKPYNIVIRLGIKYAEKGTKGMKVHTVSENEHLFIALDYGRCDVAVSSRLIGLEYIQKLQFSEIKILEPPLVKMELFHFLHKKHEKLIPEITKVLKEMQAKGRIREIRRQHIDKLIKKDVK